MFKVANFVPNGPFEIVMPQGIHDVKLRGGWGRTEGEG